MRYRFAAIVGLLSIAILVACGPEPTPTIPPSTPTTAAPQATNTTAQVEPTAPPTTQPTDTTQPTQQPTAVPTTAPQPTATPNTQGADRGSPLTLNPVTVETTDATRKGVFASKRT